MNSFFIMKSSEAHTFFEVKDRYIFIGDGGRKCSRTDTDNVCVWGGGGGMNFICLWGREPRERKQFHKCTLNCL